MTSLSASEVVVQRRSRHPIAGAIVLVTTLLLAYTFFAGLGNVREVTGHDAGAFAILFSLVLHVFAWVAIAGPVYLISRLFGR